MLTARPFRRATEIIAGALMLVAELLVLALVLMFAYEVLMRYLFSKPSGMVDQLGGLSMAAISFLALAYTYREGAHINVDLLVTRLQPRARRVQHILTELLSLAVVALLSWYTGKFVYESYLDHERFTLGVWTIPIYPFQLVMPVGLALLAVCIALDLVTSRGHPPPDSSAVMPDF
jgi:TRAP-type mannitol/chloroaromatic compound transport system, small permease component